MGVSLIEILFAIIIKWGAVDQQRIRRHRKRRRAIASQKGISQGTRHRLITTGYRLRSKDWDI